MSAAPVIVPALWIDRSASQAAWRVETLADAVRIFPMIYEREAVLESKDRPGGSMSADDAVRNIVAYIGTPALVLIAFKDGYALNMWQDGGIIGNFHLYVRGGLISEEEGAAMLDVCRAAVGPQGEKATELTSITLLPFRAWQRHGAEFGGTIIKWRL